MAVSSDSQLKVAIVHDWLVGGGAERVVEALHKLYPEASIYTSYCSDEWRQRLDGKVVTGFLQHWPWSKLRKYIGVLRIWWFARLDLRGYDVVISSTGNGEAKGITVPKGTTHICYCHSPVHYYWRRYDQYTREPGFGMFDPLARLGLRVLAGPLRRWDLQAAEGPDYFIANSTLIQGDIKKYYGRDSVVIFPPIAVERFNRHPAGGTKRHGFLTVGRQTPYKRTDIVVEACTRLNLPLTVIGRGPENGRLRKLAGPSVTFLITADDEAVASQMAQAEAFLFASLEDFGVTPVEALAAGTPVIAYKAGGALDYVQEGKTGAFFADQTVDSLCAALQRFRSEGAYDHHFIQQYAAEHFSPAVFNKSLTDFVAATRAKIR